MDMISYDSEIENLKGILLFASLNSIFKKIGKPLVEDDFIPIDFADHVI